MQALGVYVDGQELSRQVVVVGLSRESCETAESATGNVIGSKVQFWIGGLGPFGGQTEASAESRLAIRFTDPLEHAIVEHFTAA
ncbi:hypothetical protein FHS61_002820 [Altererythrobacter atlanticus]|uniref:Uncharacterized protein n=1 Tax=Croceibacterium atlanticum TaxID=1267766 RepID=A0A0F7KVN4_9SPHN|nr:hypothetical protein [Croceibacterium atlanticum]AKH43774.1 hypothetical protein WYH_02744 [Croceibacterium atlanticum]MBB5733777.1 hypothetical protein [Croceibacterium atlanticum]